MRRLAIGAAVIAGVLVAARMLAPRLHGRMLASCEGMLEKMPEDFPPKRIMLGIEEIRANTAQILELLREGTHADETGPQGELVWTTVE